MPETEQRVCFRKSLKAHGKRVESKIKFYKNRKIVRKMFFSGIYG